MDTIGVGFIGQGEEGRFHLERFRLRTDCRCEAIWFSPDDLIRGNPARLAENTVASKHEISGNPSITLVVIDLRSNDNNHSVLATAMECLQHGKHIVLGVQAFPRAQVLKELAELARSLDRQIFVPTLHRWESSFLGVQSVVYSGCLGELTQVLKISRQYVPDELSWPRKIAPDASQAMDRLWFEMLDELLELVPEGLKTVTASRESFESSTSEEKPRTATTAKFVFEGGCIAQLELNRRCFAPLETGWVLEGREGGFVDRKRFRATADFELVDVPVEFPPTNQNGFYDAVVATIRDGAPFPVKLESIQCVLELMWQCEQET